MPDHIVPTSVYVCFAVLMVGTDLTVQAAYLDLGRSIRSWRWDAVIKATLVVCSSCT